MPDTRSRVLEIPKQYRPGLAALVGLSTTAFDELFAALQRAPVTTTEKELKAWTAPEVKSVSDADLTNLISSLTSLRRVLARTQEISAEILAQDVIRALESDTAIVPDLTPPAVERIASLLKLESLSVIETKAMELKSEFEHAFCNCRIFTDLRPVFGNNVKDAPNAMLIVHTLKLGYHDSDEGKHKDFHVVLDDGDLRAMRDAIDRAEDKSKSLKTGLDSAGIKTLRI